MNDSTRETAGCNDDASSSTWMGKMDGWIDNDVVVTTNHHGSNTDTDATLLCVYTKISISIIVKKNSNLTFPAILSLIFKSYFFLLLFRCILAIFFLSLL